MRQSAQAMIPAIARARLHNQGITSPRHRRAADVVRWLGAVQAQEYGPARWALGLRLPDAADPEIERAFDRGRILRTHVMRPTWHFVAAADIRWLLELTAPRVHRRMAIYTRSLELDPRTLVRGTAVIERALRDRQHLTRADLAERLQRAGLTMSGTRLAHLAMYAELEGVICSGPRRGKQSTYALVAERAPHAARLPRDEALAELTHRYFSSHGPATVRDFVWWSGLTTADARRGLEMTRARREDVEGHSYWSIGAAPTALAGGNGAHLLPVYDEYLVSYRDRVAVPHGPATLRSGDGGTVTFQHTLVIGGQVAGTWRLAQTPRGVSLAVTTLRSLTAAERRALAEAADRYGRFVGRPVEISLP